MLGQERNSERDAALPRPDAGCLSVLLSLAGVEFAALTACSNDDRHIEMQRHGELLRDGGSGKLEVVVSVHVGGERHPAI
jgi:hypothetical protein